MTQRLHANPSGTWPRGGYPMNHVVVEPAGRRVHLTGQVGWDAAGQIVGAADAEAQTHAALDQIERCLSCVGGTLNDIVSMTTYFVREGDQDAISRARADRLNPHFGPATTGVRVAGLWSDELLVEITVIAVIPEDRFTAPDA